MDPVVVPALVATGFVVFGGLRWYFGREQRLKRRRTGLSVAACPFTTLFTLSLHFFK